jgi:hypothetical protein
VKSPGHNGKNMADVTFSSIHVADGQELGDTPQVFVQPTGKRGPRSGETLILFLDLPNASTNICADVARTLSEGYSRAPGGLTTALRLAVKLANDRLMELNRGASPAQRTIGSISCAVINHESVVIAQAGPAIAYARAQSGAFERVTPVGDLSPAGSSRSIDAFFTHYAWKPGDAFVLTGESSCRGVGDQLVNACMSKGDARLIAGYLNANVKQGRMTGVAFTVDGEPVALPVTAAATPVQEAEPAQAAPAWTPRAARSTAAAAEPPVSKGPPILSGASQAAGALFGKVAGVFKNGVGTFGSQLLPASAAQAMPVQRSRATVFGLAAAAILLPILVALLVAIGYLQFSGEAARQELVSAVLTQVEQAKSSGTADNWNKAFSLIRNYETRFPADTTTLADAKHQVQAQLDTLNKVTRIVATPIIDLNPTSVPRRIAASPLGIFVLDVANNDAQYYVLSPQRNGINGKPISLASSSGVTLTGTPLVDVTWASTSGSRWRTEGAVLFTKSVLYEYNSTSAQMAILNLPTDAASTPAQVVAGDLYNNTAYLLDTGPGQVWRYQLQNNKLVKGDPYFRTGIAQLHDAIDLAIDGAIYTLLKNGNVLKYVRAQPQTFSMVNLPQKPVKAVAIAASGNDSNTGNVFVADSDSGAVWVFTKTGDFVKQFRATNDEFVCMIDMSLDATGNTIYVTTPNKLYSFKLS